MAFSSGSRGVQIGSPEKSKKDAPRAATGRECEHQGCSTILSTYNASPTCWLHSEPTYRHSLYRDV